MRLKTVALSSLIGVFLWAGTALAETRPYARIKELCVIKDGPIRLISNAFPLKPWEVCAYRTSVEYEAFNTHELTLVLSVAYEPEAETFTRAAAGNTMEIMEIGQHLLVLGEKRNGRHLVFSLSNYRVYLASIRDRSRQFVTLNEYLALRHRFPAERIFLAARGPTTYYSDLGNGSPQTIDIGAIVAASDSDIHYAHGSVLRARCREDCGSFTEGWVPESQLSELELVQNPQWVPKVVQTSTQDLFKVCRSDLEISRIESINYSFSGGLSHDRFVGIEAKAEFERALERSVTQAYPDDMEIEWTVFLVTRYRKAFSLAGYYWKPSRQAIVIVSKVKQACGTPESTARYEVHFQGQRAVIGEFMSDASIRNSRELTGLIREAQSKFRTDADEWLLRHFLGALTAKVPG